MGLTFTKAPEVAPGEAITSTQYLKLACAFNDRLRSGVGDPTFRIQQYWYNLFRQVRNPSDGGFVFPAQGEFFELYQLLDPEYSQATWPVTGPGEPEGANMGNPMMQFIFGNNSMASESAMLGEPYFYLRADTLTPQTPFDWWAVGKLQRGVIDVFTGRQCVPALAGAQRVFQIASSHHSPHGRSYGGFFPTPIELLSSCGPSGTSGEGVPSYELKFSALRPDVDTFGLHGSLSTVDGKPVVTYAGTCPMGTEGLAAGHVVAYGKFFYNYILSVWDGTQQQWVILPVKDWIEGPYTGREQLSRPDGGQLLRALNAFAADFRGTEEQRAEVDFDIKSIAFPFQEFLTTQYYLSPAFGLTTGNSGSHCQDLQPFYPFAYYAGQVRWPKDTQARFLHDQSTAYRYHDYFVLGGMVAVGLGLAQPVTLEVRDGETVLATLQLTPDEPQTMQWLRDCPTPQDLRVCLTSPLEFTDANGWLFVEFTEQLQMLPELWDAYLLLRVMASGGGDAGSAGVDGRGRDYGAARQLGQAYFQLGCAANPQAMSLRDTAESVNDNPVYDAARRLSREHMRILARRQFLSYEVADGKSILRFKRYAYGLSHERADCFHGIAPPFEPVPSGGLVEGETYIVRTLAPAGIPGSIQYDNQTIHHGQRFTATATREFTVNGIAEVYVHDGIRHRALKGGVTNQWLMFLQTKCYHPSESSIWKPEAYADYFTWNNRCHFYTGSAPNSRSTKAHYTFNVGTALADDLRPVLTPPRVQASFIAPEAPSGYNYVDGANDTRYASEEFFKSCRVYEPDAEIESCTVDYVHGEEIVIITFTERLRACEGAPATVNRDPLTWSEAERDALWSEPYRTPDNALREYALHQARGDYQCSRKTGDTGMLSSIFSTPDNPFGSCYPHFFFTHLVPEPYQDDDERPDASDTRATVDAFLQMETYLRAMCEGFVDGQTSVQEVCAGGVASLYDYTYENLCFEAFGGRWINGFALSERPDNPAGFGPLPNTIMYAEVFNRLARSVNLLTRVRLGLQWEVQSRLDQYVDVRAVTTTPASESNSCSDGGARVMISGQAPPATTFHTSTDWSGGAIGAQVFTHIPNNCGSGSAFQLETVRQVTQFRLLSDVAETGFVHAIPAALLGLVNDHHTGFIGIRTDYRSWLRIKGLFPPENPEATRCVAAPPIGSAALFDAGEGLYFGHEAVNEEHSVCGLFHSGTLDPGTTPPPSEYWEHWIGNPSCGAGSSHVILLAPIDINHTAFIAVPLSE